MLNHNAEIYVQFGSNKVVRLVSVFRQLKYAVGTNVIDPLL